MRLLLATVLLLGLLSSAWSAGFFWTWSFTVMPGLSAAGPEVAIAAMRATNAGIRTAGFAFVFFGPAVLAALAAVLAGVMRHRIAALAAGAATLTYGAGVLAVTFLANLPLNDGLAAAAVSSSSAGALWEGYATPWTAYNHLRCAAATLVLGLLLVASWQIVRPRPGVRGIR